MPIVQTLVLAMTIQPEMNITTANNTRSYDKITLLTFNKYLFRNTIHILTDQYSDTTPNTFKYFKDNDSC